MERDSVTASFNQGVLVTPANLKHSVLAAKAWGYVSYSTTGSSYTLINSWNVLSVTSTSTGLVSVRFQVSITNTFGAQYRVAMGNGYGPTGGTVPFILTTYQAAGTSSDVAYVYLYNASTATLGNSSFSFLVLSGGLES